MVTARSPRHAARAFALLEAVVATVLLGLALSVLIGLTGRAVSSLEHGTRLETAGRLADERLQLVLATGPEAYPDLFSMSGECDEPFRDYSYVLTLVPQGGGQPYRASVTITWPSSVGRQNLTIETLIAPREGEQPDPDRKPKETVGRDAS